MGALMRRHDWTATPLGHPSGWPQPLRTVIRLLLTSNHPMFIWWGGELIQFYNDGYRQTLGPERHPSALGARGRECWAEAWHLIGPDIEAVMSGGMAAWHEDRLIPLTRFGRREDVWWTYGYSPIEDDGRVCGVLVICNDVTREHVNREGLRQSYDTLIETMDEGFCLLQILRDAAGRPVDYLFVETNRAFAQQTGLADAKGRRVRELVPAIEQRWIDVYAEVADTGVARRFVEESGTMGRWFNVYASRAAHMHDGVTLLFTDITDIKRTEAALIASEAQSRALAAEAQARRQALDALLASAPVGIVYADANGALVLANPMNRQLWGDHPMPADRHEYGAWKGWWADGSARNGRPIGLDEWPLARALRGEAVDGDLIEIEPFDQPGVRRALLVHATAIRDDGGAIVGAVAANVDVTAQRAAERELRSFADALAAASERKDEFLAMLAHELRNPLAPISSAAQILRMPGMAAQHVAHAAEVIGRQVRHMTELVDDLLDVSRVQRGLVELDQAPVDMKGVVHGAIEQARPLIERHGHLLTTRIGSNDALVLGDRKRLIQVVANLLTNAAKYTDPGGELTVTLRAGADDVRLEVADTGIGIEAALLPQVFDLFTQAKRTPDRSQGGLGLGLALVRSLVGLHGGRVEAHSDGIGKGSVFSVSLPHHRAGGAAPEGSLAPAALLRAVRRRRILVVDDNVDGAGAMQRLLAAAGHEASVVHDAGAALGLPPFDVYLLDIGLPGMSGHALATQLRARSAGAPLTLIALSGYGQRQDIAASLAAGCDAHVTKPADIGALLALIEGRQR